MAALKTTQLGGLTVTQLAGLTTTQAAALTTTLVGGLTTIQVGALSTASVGVLNTAHIAALNTTLLGGLKAVQIAALTTTNLASLSTTQVGVLSNAQIIAFTTAQALSLTTAQVRVLSTSQIASLETSDLRQLNTANIAVLTTTQMSALTAAQVCALSTTQLGALSTTQIGSMVLRSPIVLDLNDDGINTLSVQNGTVFDLNADGKPVQTGWVGPKDGLLVLDRNQDGVINDGSELFGTSTNLQNGSKAIDGYQALSELDSNQDGVVNNQDAAFSELGVWVDSNSDGLTGSFEVKSLSELGITQLNLTTNTARDSNQGNLIGLTSTYQTLDGSLHSAADVWFVVDNTTGSNDGQNQLDVSVNELKPNSSNEMVKAIGEFNKSEFVDLRTKFNDQNLTSPLTSAIVSNVNLLSFVLNEYRSNTVNAAFTAINELDSKTENNKLTLIVDVGIKTDKTNDPIKLLIPGTFKS